MPLVKRTVRECENLAGHEGSDFYYLEGDRPLPGVLVDEEEGFVYETIFENADGGNLYSRKLM